jgi:carbon monoxide dehydrogenase subunit G
MGTQITVSIEIPAPQQRVWDELADLPGHVEWMADAETVTFLSGQRSGVGTRMEVETRLGPLRTTDVMEFTAWDPPDRMAVRHQGRFTGFGELRLHPSGAGHTRLEWREQIAFPWYFGGRGGWWAARPVFGWVWKRNLRRLRDRIGAR